MKSLLSLPGALAAVLAGISVYLGHQLGEVRARAQAAEARVAELEVRVKTAERTRLAAVQPRFAPPTASPPASQPSHVTNGSTVTAEGGETPVAATRTVDRWQRMWQVPSSRALMREERIIRLKEQHPELARVLGISEAEALDLLGFLADQELRRQQEFSRRRESAGEFDFEKARAQQERELRERLGEERMRKYEAYRKGAPDRAQVRSFRSRLGEGDTLTDAQAEGLALALQQEREQYQEEIKAQMGGNATFTMGSAGGRVLMTNVSPTDEDGQEQQIIEQMQTYARRANERAATLLTPRQLKVFEELQAGQLVSGRANLRSMRDTDPRK